MDRTANLMYDYIVVSGEDIIKFSSECYLIGFHDIREKLLGFTNITKAVGNKDIGLLLICISTWQLRFDFNEYSIVLIRISHDNCVSKYVITEPNVYDKGTSVIIAPLCDLAQNEINDSLGDSSDDSAKLLYKKLCRFSSNFMGGYPELSELWPTSAIKSAAN
jgi:hypothetical protein